MIDRSERFVQNPMSGTSPVLMHPNSYIDLDPGPSGELVPFAVALPWMERKEIRGDEPDLGTMVMIEDIHMVPIETTVIASCR